MILAFPETDQMTLKTMEGTKHSLFGSGHNSLPSGYEMGAKPLIVWFETGMYFYGHWMGHKQLVSGSRHTCMQCLFCWLHATDSPLSLFYDILLRTTVPFVEYSNFSPGYSSCVWNQTTFCDYCPCAAGFGKICLFPDKLQYFAVCRTKVE